MRTVILALVVFTSSTALAIEDDLYLVFSGVGAWADVRSPAADARSAVFLPGADVSVVYGATDTLHFGITVQLQFRSDLRFPNVDVLTPEGNLERGQLFQNMLSGFGGAVLQYRFDTKDAYGFGGFVRADVGPRMHWVSGMEFLPDLDVGAHVSLPDFAAVDLSGRLLAGFEYRFDNDFVVTAGLGYRHTFSKVFSWQLELPIGVGFIWR